MGEAPNGHCGQSSIQCPCNAVGATVTPISVNVNMQPFLFAFLPSQPMLAGEWPLEEQPVSERPDCSGRNFIARNP